MGKNKKILGKFKDELGVKIMSDFCALNFVFISTYGFNQAA